MALTINTNISSLYTQQYLSDNENSLTTTLQRLSSGLRINNASDDPAGLAIAQSMAATIGGTHQGSLNGQFGINLVQTAQGAMQTILNDLQTMNALAVEAANGTNGSINLSNLDAEYQALLGEITRVTDSTNFNGVSILAGGTISIHIGAGATTNDTITVTLSDTSAGTSGLNVDGTSLSTTTNASTAITSLSNAITTLTTGLSTLGADEVNLASAIQSNNTYATNLSSAKSTLLDADYALESSNLAKFNILNQSDVAMLAQANALPQLALQLLRG